MGLVHNHDRKLCRSSKAWARQVASHLVRVGFGHCMHTFHEPRIMSLGTLHVHILQTTWAMLVQQRTPSVVIAKQLGPVLDMIKRNVEWTNEQ